MMLDLEYGHGLIEADLPDNTDVFIPGETVSDPPSIPEDLLVDETTSSLRNPIGMPSLYDLAKPGHKAVVVFPDRVKGGEQPTAHRKLAIPLVLRELYAAGLKKKDVLLICSNGLHRKNTEQEIKDLLGKDLFDTFWHNEQIINHDSEDWSSLIDLGTTPRGDPVIMNKYVYDADIAVLIGHVLGNPYGGYSGGYKHCATGITHWRSIASHHVPKVMHRDDFAPVSCHSLMRTKFDEIGKHMEKKMGKKFFCCDAVLDSSARQIGVFSGYAAKMQPTSWELADKRTYIPWATKKYDVMIFGMPQAFHYGDGMGTNPIMLMQALSAQIIRHRRVMSDNCVLICASLCNGFFNDELWPYTREMYNLFTQGYMNVLPDLAQLDESFATSKKYIDKYRFENAYHPFHGFSMTSCGHIAEMNTAAIYIVGAQEPGWARGMGLKTRATFEDALDDAKCKYTGEDPNILALPRAFKTAAVHLCMQ